MNVSRRGGLRSGNRVEIGNSSSLSLSLSSNSKELEQFVDINDSEVEGYKENYYKFFKGGDFKVRGFNGEFRCPFNCACEQASNYQYTHLLQHAIRVAEGSISRKQKAKHTAMARYLAIDLASEADDDDDQHLSNKPPTARKRSRSDLDHTTKDSNSKRKAVRAPPSRKRQPKVDGNVQKLAMAEKREKEAREKARELEEKMSEMTEEMNALITKERMSNDELQGVRKELIAGLGEIHCGNNANAEIGIKKIGELDTNDFIRELHEKSPHGSDIVMTAVEMCTLWQEKIKDPHWYPFQIVEDDTGKPQRLLKKDDLTLQALKEEWGGGGWIYDAVVKALIEVQEHNPSGCYMVPEVWNFKEQRKAMLVEVIRHVFKLEAVKGNKPRAQPRKSPNTKGC